MERRPGPLRLYTQESEHPPLDWAWVDGQLRDAGTYWVVTPGGPYPHPRPVWGLWLDERLVLSVGAPALRRAMTPGSGVTVHLDSGVDVVIVEGDVAEPTAAAEAIETYDAKYDWTYDAERYGPLATVEPRTVLAWRSAGFAGRDSFQQTGRWTYEG